MNCKGKLLDFDVPVVMGILNLTPDSFFDGGRYQDEHAILQQAEKMLHEGAQMLDIGGASSRPGAATVPESEELKRVLPIISALSKRFPEAVLSVDSWRARVAEAAVEAGASVVNDISGASMDGQMENTLAKLGVPYILMHMQGNPNTMQQNPQYQDVVLEVLDYFIKKVERLRSLGVYDIVLDPGFGFGKTVEHNYDLLRNLSTFEKVLGLPVLAGISRKSMVCKPLGIAPKDALNGTTALHMVALQQGASILRAHDVQEAVEVVKLWRCVQGLPYH